MPQSTSECLKVPRTNSTSSWPGKWYCPIGMLSDGICHGPHVSHHHLSSIIALNAQQVWSRSMINWINHYLCITGNNDLIWSKLEIACRKVFPHLFKSMFTIKIVFRRMWAMTSHSSSLFKSIAAIIYASSLFTYQCRHHLYHHKKIEPSLRPPHLWPWKPRDPRP